MEMQCSSCNTIKKFVIIVAGGSGRRMGAALEKQFLPLGKSVVLIECLKMVHSSVPEANIIIVLPEERFEFWQSLCQKYECKIEHTLVKGGSERFYSVKAAVDSIETKADRVLVAVHDGVRPFATKKIFEDCFNAAEKTGAAIACVDCTDSLRYDNKALEREKVKLVQTPQCFDLLLLKKAYGKEYEKRFTDDASLVESVLKEGESLSIVDGSRENIKLTQPIDFIIAEKLIDGKSN